MNEELEKNMPATAYTNRVSSRIDTKAFNEKYSIYQILTEEKHFPYNSRLLDSVFGEEGLRAISFSYESGTSAFVMFLRSESDIDREKIEAKIAEECPDEPEPFVQELHPLELKDYILRRLMLNSLSNFRSEKHRFNNLSGKLYIVDEVEKKKKKWITALEIGFDYRSNMTAKAVTFSNRKYLSDYDLSKIYGKPGYVFGGNNETLVRTYDLSDSNPDDVYFRKAFYDSRRAGITFFHMTKHDKTDKVTYMYDVLDLLNSHFSDCLSEPFSFVSLNVDMEKDKYKDGDGKKEMEGNVATNYKGLLARKINFINGLAGEKNKNFDAAFDSFVNAFAAQISDSNGGLPCDISISASPDYFSYNVMLLHNKEHYKNSKLDDPYKKLDRSDTVIQVITYEDLAKDAHAGKAIGPAIKTILKEMVIKGDLVWNKAITISDWSSFKYEKDWIFWEKEEDVCYFLKIAPNGRIQCFYATKEGYDKLPDDCKVLYDYMDREMDKAFKQGVADSSGNVILIGQEGRMIMPAREALVETSKAKAINKAYRRGLYGVNIYESFYEREILYSASQPSSQFHFDLKNGVLVYKSKAVAGNNIIGQLLDTLLVPFVKLNSFTVLPYPFKYVREYMEMERIRVEKIIAARKGKK